MQPLQAEEAPLLKVLVIDDEPDIVEEIVELLNDEGLVCEGVSDPEKALNMVEADREIGIIISDIRMPTMSGLELSRKLLQDQDGDRDLHIILVTGHAGMAEAIEALKLGADDFLTKPLNSEQLLHSIRRSQEAAVLRDKDRELKLRLTLEAESSASEVATLAGELAKRNEELVDKNRELLEVSQLKDEFLGMISHELNTPLNGIIGFAELLQQMLDADGENKKSELTQHITSSANRLHNHITKILNIAKAQSGSLKLNPQRFLVGDLFRNLSTKFSAEFLAKNGTINIDLDDEGMEIYTDLSMLSEALVCMIENSIKFSGDGVDVRLKAERSGDLIQFFVTDNGFGMDENMIHASLEPLRQGDGKLTRRFEGMGLGLPLARQYLRLLEGGISIESSLGEGTSINVDLPDLKQNEGGG
jgi:signal transduction histidine kinase